MMTRFKNSWELLKRSLVVLFQNKKLLVFPLVTLAATVVIAVFFLGTFIFQPTGHQISDKAHWQALSQSIFTQESLDRADFSAGAHPEQDQLEFKKSIIYFGIFLYFLSMFIATFFNVAFYHEILEALNGQPVGIIKGIQFAMTKLMPILMWSLMAGLVGYIIKTLEERLGIFGRIVVRIIGLAWSVAAVFAIPVIIREENSSNPLRVLKSSVGTLKKTWGENLIGFIGLGAASFLVLGGFSIIFVPMAVVGAALNNSVLFVGAIILWILFSIGFLYVSAVATNVFQCSLYLFASTGQLAPGYSREMLDNAWKHKN